MTESGVSETGSSGAAQPTDRASHPVSRTTAIVAGVIALGVGVVVGGAIGWKVEQNRVKDGAKSSIAAAKAKGSVQARNVRPFGVVTSVSPSSVTIRLQTGAPGSRTFTLSSGTHVDSGAPSGLSAIAKGSTVLVRPASDSPSTAAEVIVLPKGTTFGTR